MYFPYLVVISPWKRGGALHLNKLESPSPKDACAKFCRNWYNAAVLVRRRRWKCEKLTTMTTTDNFWSEKLTSRPLLRCAKKDDNFWWFIKSYDRTLHGAIFPIRYNVISPMQARVVDCELTEQFKDKNILQIHSTIVHRRSSSNFFFDFQNVSSWVAVRTDCLNRGNGFQPERTDCLIP